MFVMNMHWQNYLFSTFVILLISSLSVQVAVAQEDAVTGDDLIPLFPETLGNATLQEANGHSEARAEGTYADEEAGIQLRMAIGVGAVVDEVVPELSFMQMMGATEADDWHSEEWSIQEHTVNYMRMQGNSAAFALVDQFMLLVMAEGLDDPDALRAIVEDYDFSQLEEWEAPGEYARHSMSADICLTVD